MRRAAFLATMLSLPLFAGLWQLAAASHLVNALLFPPPTRVLQALYGYLGSREGWTDIGWSLARAAIGYGAGAAAGIATGLLTGANRVAAGLFTPVFQLLRPIPPIAFVPIVIVWFGLSEFGKWFVVCWGVFFTVWLSTHLGLQRTSETYVRAARSLGADASTVLWTIRLPAALPFVFVGLRTGITIAFYALVSAELAGASAGVAYRLAITQQNLQIATMMAGLLVLGFLSLLADRLFEALARHVVHWSS
ncbi:ABC transporter permease [Paraburkholderia lycopersici]|uniref:NitT/TauT family transport system permease protein n=1 Tax=Paraburkholderia lycopersici TaxID=416944 RepID=A0A1G6Q9R1_9BURK|nr:ABC transporter permease [Paraburkholderia lycopersici]SDC88397.1 NitT/TauT family transport system permease protein [Paraburkholderia lycopersici]